MREKRKRKFKLDEFQALYDNNILLNLRRFQSLLKDEVGDLKGYYERKERNHQTRWISSMLNLKNIPISRDRIKSLERRSRMVSKLEIWNYEKKRKKQEIKLDEKEERKENQTRRISSVLNLKRFQSLVAKWNPLVRRFSQVELVRSCR